MVDLHLHTTVSDGLFTPAELVDRVWVAGVHVMAVTDHDTVLATEEVRTLAAARGIEAVSGIEITAVENGQDVHLLGYFLREDGVLSSFLSIQRRRRVDRIQSISERLATLGMPVDVGPLLAEAKLDQGRSIGRPQIGQAMIVAGHVATLAEAFDRWLAFGRPAFVPREGPSCEAVIAVIHDADGLASLAHPGKTAIDPRIPALCRSGLDALEAYHSDHDAALTAHYVRLAREHHVLVTGGSDFHGEPSQRRSPGSCALPEADWLLLKEAAGTHA